MTTLRVRRVRLFSAGKMFGFVFAVLGFLAGIPFALVALAAGGATAVQAGDGSGQAYDAATSLGIPAAVLGVVFGVGAIVILPLLYGFFGFVVGFLHALVYNVVAGFVGGLVLETD